MTEPAREDAPMPPDLWPRELDVDYECLAELGRGGMAVVFRARERALGRDVAIKVVRPRFASDHEAAARLVREAKVVAQLQHPNVVALYAIRRLSDESVALVMQLVPGRTLKAALREEGPLDPARAEQVLQDMARALAYAHRAGVVHRDVKPENIFLDDISGRALLSDFGIARAMDSPSELTATGTTIGTPTYMAPEQIDGGPLDGRSDLYSLGMVAWEMLSGEQPWAGESLYTVIYRQKHDLLPPLESYRDDVPPRLQYLVEGLLHKNPDRRWVSAARLLRLLSSDEAPPGMREWQSANRRRRRSGGQPAVRQRGGPEVATTAQTMKFVRGTPAPTAPPGAAPAEITESAVTALPPAALPRQPDSSATPASPGDAPRPLTPPSVASVSATPRGQTPVGTTPGGTPAVLTVPRRRTPRAIPIALAAIVIAGGGAWAWSRLRPVVAPTPSVAPTTTLNDAGRIEVPVVAPADSARSDARTGEPPAVASAGAEPRMQPPASPASPVAGLSAGADSARRPATPSAVAAAPNVGAPAPAPRESVRAPGAAAEAPVIGVPPGDASARGGAGAPVASGAEATPVTATPPPAPRVMFPPVRRTVAAGGRHSCVIRDDDRVACWGSNERGQVGDGGFANHPTATPVVGDFAFTAVAAGGNHTCGVTREGSVLCWGNNAAGQLGDGTTSVRAAPVRVNSSETFISVTTGLSHSCATTRSGRVFCWGANTYGQLGDGSRQARSSPVAVALPGAAAVLAVGWNHSCAIVTDGAAYCWGRNDAAQLGDGTTDDRAVPVAVATPSPMVGVSGGSAHTCGVTPAGAVLCWGRNNYGQVGAGVTGETQATPLAVALDVPAAAVSVGSVHACARGRDGSAWCWGRNSNGQLGDGTSTDRARPVAVRGLQGVATLVAGGSHTCARTGAGEAWCWGYNVDGQVGRGDRENALVPARVAGTSR